MTKNSQMNPIDIVPGVMPSTDATASDIPCWADSLHVRFDPTTGRLRKIGGWTSTVMNSPTGVMGTIRTVYSAIINQKTYTLLGTNSNLYALIGSILTNITPLDTTPIAAANSLATHYGLLGANPIATTINSTMVTVTDPDYARYQVGDSYTLSGATATGGVPIGELNAPHVIRSIGVGTVSFRVPTTATSIATGGGVSVNRTDGQIRLTKATHGQVNGARVRISGAAATGGISALQINLEFIIRNVTTNTFDIVTAGTATSAVTGGGGAATVFYPQIPAGKLNQGSGQGYGAGLYGVGLYGTALVSPTGESYPRIWFCDRFGDNIVLTPGLQSGCYTWNGDTTIAPTLIPNAPTVINYLFVSDNILVTFGNSLENEIFASDQGDYTQWTASSTNQVFQDVIEGAGRFISHCPVDGYNLIFTEQQTYTFKYIGGASIWEILPLDPTIGLIAPMARVSVNGYAYWQGQNNFYMFRGGKIEIIPCNFATQSSILQYVFTDLNYGQRYKFFAGYNETFDEIWFHDCTASANECDSIARFNRKLQCWVPDKINRTAWEYPLTALSNPRLANVNNLYTHESGANDDTNILPFFARMKKFVTGKETAVQTQIVPDSIQTGTIQVQMRMYNYPQSASAMNDITYDVTGTTERIPVQQNGRFYDVTISGAEMDQTYLMGQWYTEPQPGAPSP